MPHSRQERERIRQLNADAACHIENLSRSRPDRGQTQEEPMATDDDVIRLEQQVRDLQAQLVVAHKRVAQWQTAFNHASTRVNSAMLLHKNAGEEAATDHHKALDRVQQAFADASKALAESQPEA